MVIIIFLATEESYRKLLERDTHIHTHSTRTHNAHTHTQTTDKAKDSQDDKREAEPGYRDIWAA